MDFLILVAQRKSVPRGEYEALEVIDGDGDDANPQFMGEKLEEARLSGQFDAVTVMKVRVPDTAVTQALFPSQTPVAGEVC